ncbi:glycosyltransferase [Pseudacidovorax intermedius]|uniref:glycosyltransferase n=1 Tax=Pseudacidovorax intermedius TaxID=433924 RepID=UPI0009E70AB5|nr:glycosyltransferase [Pseudacidovorax intermedius]
MLKMAKVGVLLAAYNGEAWIGEQVQSILGQKGVETLLKIRDDASSDSTVACIKAQFMSNPRVELEVASKSSGSAGGNFRQLILDFDSSNVDYVAFSDQDDVWFENKLANAVECLNLSSYDGYSASVLPWDGNKKVGRGFFQSSSLKELDFIFEGAGQGCTFVLTRQAFIKIQKLVEGNRSLCDDMHFHDWLVYVLVRAWGGRWFFDSRVTMFYRQHATNDIGSRVGMKGISKRLSLLRSGWYSRQCLAAAAVYSAVALERSSSFSIAYELLRDRMERSLRESVQLAMLVARQGRRKIGDRLILVGASIFRWI